MTRQVLDLLDLCWGAVIEHALPIPIGGSTVHRVIRQASTRSAGNSGSGTARRGLVGGPRRCVWR
jgi:hypothetical protein